MRSQGANNYKGINYQSRAAMSLFLQFLKEPGFSYIHLEDPMYKDFNLVFDDGHKIICEVKNYTKQVSYADLKKILESITKNNKITKEDKILIICASLSKKMKEKVKFLRYYDIGKEFDQIDKKIKNNFSEQLIEILQIVDFWQVKETEQCNIFYSLFRELLNYNVWLPENVAKEKADSVLIEKIYSRSQESSICTKKEIYSYIEEVRQDIIEKSKIYDKQRVKKNKQLREIKKLKNNSNSPLMSAGLLSALTADRDLMFFALNEFKGVKINKLQLWDNFWQIAKSRIYSFGLFDIFEKNLHNKENISYVINFIKENLVNEQRNYYSEDLFEEQSIELLNKMIEGSEYGKDIFDIVKMLIDRKKFDYFYLQSQKGRDLLYWKSKLVSLLKKIYLKTDESLRASIFELLINTFNLIKDEGEFSLFTPVEVFALLREYVIANIDEFENNFVSIKNVLSRQYSEYYKKYGYEYNGWELIGGTTETYGNEVKIEDRHFIKDLLSESMVEYQKLHPDKAWSFIVNKCLFKEKEINYDKPDFLNRTCIPFLLEKYFSSNEEQSNLSFEWLKDFILSRKGIPHKADLIYQEIYKKHLNKEGLPIDKLWKILEVGINRYELPISTFLDKIVSELVKRKHKEAIEAMKIWLKNPKYQATPSRADRNFVANLRNLIEVDYKLAVELYKKFINGEYFINQYDDYDVYGIAGLLNSIIIKNPDTGIGILKEINNQVTLSKNQQILLTNSILNYKERDTDKPEILLEVYEKFINPLLDGLNNDVNSITERFYSYARESIVKFAERLVATESIKDNIGKALRIIRVFMNDPDPYLPGQNPEDRENKFNEHIKVGESGGIVQITSVRGWCAHILRNCVTLKGRKYIEEIINLTEKLTKDSNYYMKQMSCFPLAQLASNRLTVMPDNANVLFLNDDRKEALQLSKRIEGTAFSLLEDIIKIPDDKTKEGLTQGILSVFSHIKALNGEDALRFLRLIQKLPDESIAETIPLFVYFALFRKDSFRNWKLKEEGLYDDIEKFDDSEFVKILENLIKNGNTKIRESLVHIFWTLPEKTAQDGSNNLLYIQIVYKSSEYLKMLAEKYDYQVYEGIFYFIKDFINVIPRECIDLWKKCVEKQRPFFIENKQLAGDLYWRLGYCHEDVLLKIKEVEGDDEFLKWFEFFSEYPVIIPTDLSKVVEELLTFPKDNAIVRKILNNLVAVNSSFYGKQQEWEKKKT